MKPLLSIRHLQVHFAESRHWWCRRSQFRAVHDVSFELQPHEFLGLVGESGSGKSSLAKAILQLLSLTAGEIYFDGERLYPNHPQLLAVRRRMQVVFQDPLSALNPRHTIARSLSAALDIHRLHLEPTARQARLEQLVTLVGLESYVLRRYPHQLSGGQLQRICIARALAVEPELLICDESVSALDVTVKGQIVRLLLELRAKLGLSCLFISHDIQLVRQLCDRVGVMYRGELVELASSAELFAAPQHPYTRKLLAAVLPLFPTLPNRESIYKESV
jgi:peptide/nickel transport system ATP-binding protein